MTNPPLALAGADSPAVDADEKHSVVFGEIGETSTLSSLVFLFT
jgi:hypothetical protein